MQAYCRKKIADEGQGEVSYMHEYVQEKESDDTLLLGCNIIENV